MSNLAKILTITTALLAIISITLVACNLIVIGIIIFFITAFYFGTTMAVIWADIVDKVDL